MIFMTVWEKIQVKIAEAKIKAQLAKEKLQSALKGK